MFRVDMRLTCGNFVTWNLQTGRQMTMGDNVGNNALQQEQHHQQHGQHREQQQRQHQHHRMPAADASGGICVPAGSFCGIVHVA